MSRDDRIVVYTYFRFICGEYVLVYVVLWKMSDIDGFSDDEFSDMVCSMPYTRCAKTAQRIAKKMDDDYGTEYGVCNADCYSHIVISGTESLVVPALFLAPTPASSPTSTPASSVPAPSIPAPVPVPATSTIAEAKWLMLFKIRELETALAACRLQLETIDIGV